MNTFLKRKAYDALVEWKAQSNGKTAILIEGARRVGKSTVAEEFAKASYDDYLLLDFAKENTAIRENFENIGTPDVFFRNLFLLKGKELPKRKAAIIFDEVQLFPPARQAIKALVADGRYDYIETGSLISIKKNVADILIPSEERKLKMYPMDFEEFLWAIGDAVTFSAIGQAFDDRRPLDEAVHRKILTTYRSYLAVGGMPQAVVEYVNGASYQTIDSVKRDILALYCDDLEKYDGEERARAAAVFRSIPSQLSHHNSRFRYSEIGENARASNTASALAFLGTSMMANLCLNVTAPEAALELYADPAAFKLYMGDTGLLVSQIMQGSPEVGDAIYKNLVTGKLGVNLGMVMENAVAQALVATGHKLYFHSFEYKPEDAKKPSLYEIDFLTVRGKRVCPIEVKSSGYRSHKSFDYFKEKYKLKMNERFIVYSKNLTKEGDITFIPFYMASCL
ncbi:MAG: ATP-binding protein [Eggerthellaceae bacterium]|nr:ATP-binding protein [Eggerthellaceae bacterium]